MSEKENAITAFEYYEAVHTESLIYSILDNDQVDDEKIEFIDEELSFNLSLIKEKP